MSHPLAISDQEAAAPKRVALFAGAYNHIADGVSLTLNRLVKHLAAQDDTAVRVFAPTIENPALTHAGTFCPVPSVPALGRPEYRISLGLSTEARQVIQAFDPTIFHIATPDLLGFHALQTARRKKRPVVASYHTHFSSYLKYYKLTALEPVLWSYLRSFYTQCEHIYVPSSAMADILRAHGITEGLRPWERGIDTEAFHPKHRSLSWRRERGIKEHEVVVGFVSRLVWEKGLALLPEIHDALKQRGCDARMLIVGDGPAREELEEALPDAHFTGFLRGTELATAYASADAFVFPSDTETFGNVTLEAMASGVPTVCADAVGSRDLVDEGTTGFLCPPGNVHAFADALAQLIQDDSRRSGMAEAARTRAHKYEWATLLKRMDRYYDELIARSEEPSAERAPALASQPA
ncbi:MAG: glycosyltransferase family 1 protein [Longimonas sp.]|uniref:glycosyltransferase family 4 protein n=1 Tax=Longimonas sp. TaxID=2039626 RepID=UPI00334F6073